MAWWVKKTAWKRADLSMAIRQLGKPFVFLAASPWCAGSAAFAGESAPGSPAQQAPAGRSWGVHEIAVDGGAPRRVDKMAGNSMDACYLPNGRILFTNDSARHMVPCNNNPVALMYVMDADGGGVRQLAFDQDMNFNPVVSPDGRVMYARWDYNELDHVVGRKMFTMNLDGTNQMELYGSNSYWPMDIFGARALPDRPGGKSREVARGTITRPAALPSIGWATILGSASTTWASA